MARTRKFSEALNLARKRFPGLNDSSFAQEMLDQANSMMWRWYDWPQSIKELPPMYMNPDEADIQPPARVVPSDFWKLNEAWIRVISGKIWDLKIVKSLQRSTFYDRPTTISWEPSFAGFRLHPVPSTGWAAPWAQVEAKYKTTPTKITQANIHSETIPYEDVHFKTFNHALVYQILDTLGDPAAGAIQIDRRSGNAVYTGAFGNFVNSLMESTQNEREKGDLTIAPTESFELG